jgi:D-hydroxyproline dehydrogenase subunit beta
MMSSYDVVVVGGGVVGLAHAWMAAERGLSVLLLERNAVAQGASVRNFGMLWPIGQPSGELHAVAMRSRERWLALYAAGVVDIEPCGSIHVAHRADELAVLEEFCGLGSQAVEMLSADAVMQRAPIVNPSGLLGGMLSGTEMRVNPRVAAAQIAQWLQAEKQVTCGFNTMVAKIDGHRVYTADGHSWSAERILICSGADLQSLYPSALQNVGLKLCKLQMLKAVQARSETVQPHIASGLTLRHYSSFGCCPSLTGLKQRVASESPELDHFGIHVMASPFRSGEILLGDSHEYDADLSPFDKVEIDELIVRELRKIIRLNDWTMHERWHGIYAKHPNLPAVELEVEPGVFAITGTGGSGMTMSFGLAERTWKRWMGEYE